MVDLYGSLSLTGKGHATDVAIIMGLAGNSPQDVVIDEIPAFIELVTRSGGCQWHLVRILLIFL